MNSDVAVGRRAMLVRAIVFGCIALVYVVLQLQQSLAQGRHAYPITYDDAGYYYEGLSRLYLAYDSGLGATIVDLAKRPPHSVWSTGIAFFGFATFGAADWAPLIANAFIVAIAAVTLVWATAALPFGWALAILVATLTWRYVGHFALEFRPDMAWGLALAGFVLIASLAVQGPLSRPQRRAAAALLAIALIAKMTTAPVTIAVAGAASAGVVAMRRYDQRESWRHSLAAISQPILVAALLVSPIYLIAGPDAARYVYAHVFGAEANTWNLPLSTSEHLLYHLVGTGGNVMMGPWLVAWGITLCVAGAVARHQAAWRACRPAVPYALAFIVAFLAVTVPSHKSPHIGAIVPAMFLVSWVALAVFIGRRASAQPRFAAMFSILVWSSAMFGLAQFQWHSGTGPSPSGAQRNAEAQWRRETVRRILEDVESSGITSGSIFVAGATLHLNADVLRYYALRRHRPAPDFNDSLFAVDPAVIAKRLDGAQGVVSFSEGNPDIIRFLPSGSASVQRATNEAIDRKADMRSFRYPTPGGGEVRLHLVRDPFENIQAARGLGDPEGPYPQWRLPVVRWGLGPETVIRPRIGGSAMQMHIDAQSPLAGQAVTVVLDGTRIADLHFPEKDVPRQFIVDLGHIDQGSTIALRYATQTSPGADDKRPMAVLFRKLQIRP